MRVGRWYRVRKPYSLSRICETGTVGARESCLLSGSFGVMCGILILISNVNVVLFMKIFNKMEGAKKSGEENVAEFKKDIAITREHHSVEDYVEQLQDKGYEVVSAVVSCLKEMGIEEGDDNASVVRVTLEDLGLSESDGVAIEEILAVAEEQGLGLCPAWVALQYCLNSLEHYVDENDVHRYAANFGMKLPKNILEDWRKESAMRDAKQDIKMKIKKGKIDGKDEEEVTRLIEEQAMKYFNSSVGEDVVISTGKFSNFPTKEGARNAQVVTLGEQGRGVWVFVQK